MNAMLSISLRSPNARRYFICAAPLVAALVLSLAAFASTPRVEPTPGPHATPTAALPMRFVKVRSDSLACRPDCPEWIAAEGKIVTGSADALERTLKAAGNRRLPIVINSAGGSVRDAMAMGRLIRERRLAVVVAQTTFAPCPLSARSCGVAKGVADSRGAYCASACTLVLAAGVERYVSPLSYVGVHQMTEIVSKTQVERLYSVRYLQIAGLKVELSRHQVGVQRSTSTAKLAASDDVDDEVSHYFTKMGVADPVMELTLVTPSTSIHWLTTDELRISRLATAWVDGAKPIVDAAQPSGLAGLAVEPPEESASQFIARASAPLAAPIGDRRATLEVTFAFRRGGAAVATTLMARDAETGAPLDLPGVGAYLIFYPEGAEYRLVRPAATEPPRVVMPLRAFCGLRRGEHGVVSFIAGPGPANAQRLAPIAIDPLAAEGAATIFEEACPPKSAPPRAIASAGGVNDSRSP
jgi:hypothetical protein